ncbi:pyruvate formate lyase-activating protein [Dysgonomonas sp. Marseille-P4677]|uniref:pyruvate formate-lyase-activating protein n=1 Tax=Dysgonomonas sp. Marseille-P4677 TaxID=2364790 RepID=UPI00191418AF|nr:pyruvate formate-lyase-activating protein [Dysgonomonas sp. Marseille-P4677]MBK5720932.1 pyruvate formate lyase-activating protein [Dysgonomonas sp. Marseille-P4677]
MQGYIHSFETFGTKDGPGIRFVLFMQGCPLRCLYCHNPDTWKIKKAKYELTPQEVFQEINKVKAFVRGGVTISGGEPLLQPEFILELFKICKEQNIHTAIDTSGILLNEQVKQVLEYTDLVLLDIKHINSEKYKKLTNASLEPTLKFMDYLASMNKSTWLRYVLVPNYTDEEEDLKEWARYASQFKNVERVDVLPFHQMAIHKWDELNIEYKLRDITPTSLEQKEKAETIFKSFGLPV